MIKPPATEEHLSGAPNDAGGDENVNLVEHLEKERARRAYAKFMALKGKIHLDINVDELRGRNR